MLREFFEATLLRKVAAQVPGVDAPLRVSLAASHLIGVAVLRYVVGFEELRGPTVEELATRIGPRIQSYFTP